MINHEYSSKSSNHLHRGALIMGAALVGGLVEVGRAIHEKHQPTVAGVESYFEDEGPSFIFVRGCGENYQAQAPLFHQKLGGYGSLHFEYQVQGRHSQDIVDQNVIEACKSDGDRDRVLVCSSMGLMNTMRSLTNPAVRHAIGDGRLKAIVSRSGITSREDLQPSMQRAAGVSAHLPSLSVIGAAVRMNRLHQSHQPIAHSDKITAEAALMHHESSAYMPFSSLVSSQHREIYESTRWADGSHRMIVDQNPGVKLYHITADYDHVADRHRTVASLERTFEQQVEVVVDERRPHGSHADDLEYPEPLEEIMMKLTGHQRSIASAARNLVAYNGGYAYARLAPAS